MAELYDRSLTGNVERADLLLVSRGGEVQAVLPCPEDHLEEVAHLWRNMPTAEQMRCHLPRYGLRLFIGPFQTVEATLCWQCNNIWLTVVEGSYYRERFYSTFDGSAAVSRRLLQIVRDTTGSEGAA